MFDTTASLLVGGKEDKSLRALTLCWGTFASCSIQQRADSYEERRCVTSRPEPLQGTFQAAISMLSTGEFQSEPKSILNTQLVRHWRAMWREDPAITRGHSSSITRLCIRIETADSSCFGRGPTTTAWVQRPSRSLNQLVRFAHRWLDVV